MSVGFNLLNGACDCSYPSPIDTQKLFLGLSSDDPYAVSPQKVVDDPCDFEDMDTNDGDWGAENLAGDDWDDEKAAMYGFSWPPYNQEGFISGERWGESTDMADIQFAWVFAIAKQRLIAMQQSAEAIAQASLSNYLANRSKSFSASYGRTLFNAKSEFTFGGSIWYEGWLAGVDAYLMELVPGKSDKVPEQGKSATLMELVVLYSWGQEFELFPVYIQDGYQAGYDWAKNGDEAILRVLSYFIDEILQMYAIQDAFMGTMKKVLPHYLARESEKCVKSEFLGLPLLDDSGCFTLEGRIWCDSWLAGVDRYMRKWAY